MKSTNEQIRADFSRRLKDELERLRAPISSPTQISRLFNRRFPGRPVTPQTVRKWLLAEALPAQPKLLALAEWFGVSAQWLRFGTGSREGTPPVEFSHAGSGEIAGTEKHAALMPLIEKLGCLSSRDIDLVTALVNRILAIGQD